MISPIPHYFFFYPGNMIYHQLNLTYFLVPGFYLPFNYFYLFLSSHLSFFLFFVSHTNFCFYSFGCFLFSNHFNYSDCPLSLPYQLHSNPSFPWALVLSLPASPISYFCTIMETPDLSEAMKILDFQDRVWRPNWKKLCEAFKLVTITAISWKGRPWIP